MSINTPTEFLAQSKEIVYTHKALLNNIRSIEQEIEDAEHTKEFWVSAWGGRGEQGGGGEGGLQGG